MQPCEHACRADSCSCLSDGRVARRLWRRVGRPRDGAHDRPRLFRAGRSRRHVYEGALRRPQGAGHRGEGEPGGPPIACAGGDCEHPAADSELRRSNVDVIVAMTTPVLTAASSAARSTPVVFTYVYDPIAAGAGKSATDHLPHVTGVGSFPPVQDTVDTIQRLVPGVRSVGTLYNSSEANSVKVVGVARGIFKERGIKLQEIAITGTGEIYQAAQVLTQRGVQALWVTGDNTALQGF